MPDEPIYDLQVQIRASGLEVPDRDRAPLADLWALYQSGLSQMKEELSGSDVTAWLGFDE